MTFNGNEATKGGAIYNAFVVCELDSNWNVVSFEGLKNSILKQNTAQYGGAVFVEYGAIMGVKDTSFTGNTATDAGGAFYVEGAASYDNYFGTNYASGATLLYTATGSPVEISGNKASNGGFLYLDGYNNYSDQGVVGAQATFDIQGAGTTLTVGAWDSSTDDSIYAETGATFIKTGEGAMHVRSTYTNEGALIVEKGTLAIEGITGVSDGWATTGDVATALEPYADSVVLALGTSLKVGDGLCVGGGYESTTDNSGITRYTLNEANSAYFAANSALVVHADGTNAQGTGAALIGNGTDSVLTVEEGAKLIVCGGNADNDIRIAQGFVAEEEVEASALARGIPAPKSSIDGWAVETDVTHVNPLYTISDSYWAENDFYLSLEADTAALGDLAQLASIAGVASNTASIATSAMDASGARFAFGAFEPELERSFNLWATPLFSSVYADGFDSSRDGKGGRSGYDTTYGGMNIGADYTTDAGYRFGLGLHAGYGETESHGDYEHTDNDFSFWGVTLYGGRTWDDFSVYADVNMSMTKSDLVQNNPLFADAPLEAETDAYALTAELRADYRISTEYMEILPHVGARFMNVNIDDYDVKQLGDTICSVESQDQNIWSFPVGVELSKTFDLGAPSQDGQTIEADQAGQRNWTLTPRLDLGVIFAAGDIDADSTAFMPDRSVSQSMTMQTFDCFAYTANIGVDMEYGASTFALEYGTRLSEHQTVQDVTATWRYEF